MLTLSWWWLWCTHINTDYVEDIHTCWVNSFQSTLLHNLCIMIFHWNMLIHKLLHLILVTTSETVYCRWGNWGSKWTSLQLMQWIVNQNANPGLWSNFDVFHKETFHWIPKKLFFVKDWRFSFLKLSWTFTFTAPCQKYSNQLTTSKYIVFDYSKLYII